MHNYITLLNPFTVIFKLNPTAVIIGDTVEPLLSDPLGKQLDECFC